MGQAIEKLLKLAQSQDEPETAVQAPIADVHDIIARLCDLSDNALSALDDAVDKELAARAVPDPDDE